ncbi:two-component response regulator, LytT family [Psychroflexus torquis ATCC 700755]|uniref:Two-component response regulator, LytT family n=1 Tax=Psychroflexus torquis (strain ATCC 700755 / CIP 106069 / ACAM 623) TaxID=313595 RepID=K4IYN2_PSYTT|nr:LytTR family DNA-binding domain-containing protein [Psychroflexus torquis]AFU70575.1 two-component response regulator, LytT family [Psychroflexus torquis ATCC 700755]
MITYLIIDDEYIAHDIIKGYCGLLPNMQLMKNCYDALEAVDYLNNNTVDLIFLDLNMPKLKGFEFLKTLTLPPKVIVTTAYREFALEGYELNISDYLLKPFGFERFLKAINKTVSVTTKTTKSSVDKKDAVSKSIFLRSNTKYIQVTMDIIQYIEAAGNYTKVTTTKETIAIREKISDILELLNDIDFIQVHKSFAVSKKHIKSIEGNRIFISETIIPIGKTYKVNIIQLLK